ncbi:hypothetical protein TPA0910_52570 [Streptomyces hygroscopicus subsp. sporocinereus]|uniref:Uncharacterized protein n=1 Tax=Streptomyces hygroscopicus TaxID=1912 RepID=A0ABQ3U5E5_STRHY|nr:hypothetical protein [Streptomyces hygroscopicus]GHJ30824.1 hypothetical protein TPA0910_52570 [Streptomyces hygroscopicus]
MHAGEEGTRETRETDAAPGEVDHRDPVLTDEQRASGETMTIRVTRRRGPRWILDLKAPGP